MSRPPVVRARLFAAIPPALLAVMACVQITLARSAFLAPWKGGGFGMFATTDGAANRTIRVLVTGPERSQEIEVPSALVGAAAACEAFPTEPCLDGLARRLAEAERLQGRPVSSVRLQVWRTEFAPVTLVPRRRLLLETLLITRSALD
jgi:hypothetical protein